MCMYLHAMQTNSADRAETLDSKVLSIDFTKANITNFSALNAKYKDTEQNLASLAVLFKC